MIVSQPQLIESLLKTDIFDNNTSHCLYHEDSSLQCNSNFKSFLIITLIPQFSNDGSSNWWP